MKRQVSIIIAIVVGIGIGMASISTIFWIIVSQNGETIDDNEAPVIVNYYPLTNPSINDTEIQEFNITANDPDGDALTYSWYLNGTKVGGNSSTYIFIANTALIGTSIVVVNITDGDLISSHSWILTVLADSDFNEAPVIVNYYPLTNPSIDDTEIQEFNITANDPDGDALTYSWYLNGTNVGGNSSSYIFVANTTHIGTSIVVVNITDGDLISTNSWNLTVIASTYEWSAADCPGAPGDINASQIIRVGVIGDTERRMGQGSENGAWLAAYEINSAGGVTVGGEVYYIGISSENSDEENPVLNMAVAVSAAEKLINYKRVQFGVGGFRTETVLAHQDLWMENQTIFFSTGASSTALPQKVLDDYSTYKYFFQPSPLNSSALASMLIETIISIASFQTTITGHNITRFSFLREDLAWSAGFAAAMIGPLTNNDVFNLTFTGSNIEFAPDATNQQMEAHWNSIQAANTQIVIPLVTGSTGYTYMNSYASVQPNCIPIGINLVAQDENFWTDLSGDAAYGVTLESVFETNKTSLTIPFWNHYVGNFSTTPGYTATGSYDAIYQLAWAIEGAQSFVSDTLVVKLENLRPCASLEGAGGFAAYDLSHTPVYGYPYGTGLAIQWVAGVKKLVPAPGIYPSGVYEYALSNMSPLTLPSWGLYYYD